MPPREAMINREASAARGEFARVGIYVLTVVKNRSHARRMSDYLYTRLDFRPVFGHVPAAERSSKKHLI
jgi:hypothetical protein